MRSVLTTLLNDLGTITKDVVLVLLLGPGCFVGVGNGLILGYLVHRSRLVPRGLAVLGLVGGSLVCLSGTAVLLGVTEAGSARQVAARMTEFFWGLSLGVS